MGTADTTAGVLDAADQLIEDGNWWEAIEAVTAAAAETNDPSLDHRLTTLRHAGFDGIEHSEADPEWPGSVPDIFADSAQIPEIAVADLNRETLAAGLLHHGSLVVRGLLEPPVAERLLGEMKKSFVASAASADGAPVEDTAPYYVPFEPGDGYSFGFFEQFAARAAGGVLMAESPRLLRLVTDAYRQIGLGDVLEAYLGEWPALSVKKSTLRYAPPQPRQGWHQDGRFLGEDIHTVNVWTSLTHSGAEAPGVEMFHKRFDHIVETGTEGAEHDWSVGEPVAHSYGEQLIERPVFAPGDALFFDQMALHQTGRTPAMTKERYALETWFFGPSTYPYEQVPLLF